MSDDKLTDVSSEAPNSRRRLPKSVLWGMLLGFTFSLFPIALLRLFFYVPLPAFLSFIPQTLFPLAFIEVLFAIVALPVFAVATLWARLAGNRRQAALSLAALSISALSWCASPIFHRTLIPPVLHAGVLRTIQNAKPLIAAIEQYQKDTGAYPENLDALLPRYLDKIPRTGMAGFPGYRYFLPRPDDEFTGYRLRVPMTYCMDFDDITYYPNGFPGKIDGKTHIAIQDWVFFDD